MGGLTAEELAAARLVAGADLEELRAALARMPKHSRSAIRWLARELELVRVPQAPAGGTSTPALVLERLMQRAALERSRLERLIATSEATPQEKAFMQQTLAHLWRAQLETREPCPSVSRHTSR